MFEPRFTERPYPGLRPFEPHEADIFFGREAHTDRLLGILQRERFLAVIGPSGSGKSSLVRAGLLPALALGSLGTGSDWRVAVLRPGHQPMLRLAQALLAPQVLGVALLPKGQPQATPADELAAEAELRRGPLGLVHLVESAQLRSAAAAPEATPAFNLLVLVDQFEEIFTYAGAGGAQADESDAFVNLLLAAKVVPAARIFVALTMRTDFLGQCVRFLELPEAINHAQYLTPRLKRAELEAAITGPAAVFGGALDAGLVAELINASGQHEDQLPLVQHALARMWAEAQRRQPDAPVLDWAVAEAVGVYHGNVMGALNQHADELLCELSEEQQVLAEGLFRAITERRQASEGGQDVRRPQQLRLIAEALGCPWESLVPVVACFAAPEVCFLQHGPVLNAESVIDLSHEALMRQWGTLRGWVVQEAQWAAGFVRWRERTLEEAAAGGLLAGAELARAQEWVVSTPGLQEALEPLAGQVPPQEVHARRYAPAGVAGSGLAQVLAFVAHSTQAEQQRQAQAREQAERELALEAEKTRLAEERRNEAERHARTLKRRNWLLGVLMGLSLLLAAGAGGFWWQSSRAQDRLQETLVESTVTRLAAESSALFTGERSGGDIQALRFALAAYRVRPENTEVLTNLQRTVYGNKAPWLLGVESASSVNSVAFSPDGSRIVSGSYDNTLQLWDAKTGLPIGQPLKGHSGYVSSVAFSPDGLRIVSGSDDNTLRLWDANTGLPIGQPLKGHSGYVSSVAFSPGGSRIVSGSHDNTLRLWDANTRLPIGQPLSGHSGAVSSVAFSPDGLRIISGSFDGTLRIWDTNTGLPTDQPLSGHSHWVTRVAFSPDGSRIVSGSIDKTLRLWDAKTGLPIGQPLSGHSEAVNDVAFSPDGLRIVSGSADKTLRLWDAKTGLSIGLPLFGHSSYVYSVAFSPDGSRIVSGSEDNTLRLWDVNTGPPIGQPLSGHSGHVYSVAFSPDGSRIVSGREDNTLQLWDAKTGLPIGQPLSGHSSYVYSVAFSPDGLRIVSGSHDKTLRLWDGNTGLPIGLPLKGHSEAVISVAFSLDGSRIVSGSQDQTLQRWDANTGLPIGLPLKGHSGYVSSVAFSPDGLRIVSGSWDKTLRLWDAKTGLPIGQPLKGRFKSIYSVAFSPDGLRIASGNWDETLQLWDANTGLLIGQPLKGHTSYIHSVAFSPDGLHIVSGSYDKTLRLWDVKTGLPIGQPLAGHSERVNSVAFSPDGLRIASGSMDNTIRLWPAPAAWPALLCSKLTRNFSHKEWLRYVGTEIPYKEQCPGLPVPADSETP